MSQHRSIFEQSVDLPVSAAEAFAWHERPGAFGRLTPPWERVRLLSHTGGIRDGARVELEVPIGPFKKRWIAEHRGYRAGEQFQDVQLSGPFTLFEHTHRITPRESDGATLTDHIEYIPPGGVLGRWLGGGHIRRQLSRMFRYRHEVTARDLRLFAELREQPAMRIAVTGATGLVGRSLVPFLTTQGHEVSRLVRSAPQNANDIPWDPLQGVMHSAPLEGVDAVVHLAGENIAGARWNDSVKARIRSSRVDCTRLLCEQLAGLKVKPKTLICASATGFYGDRGSEILTENSPAGQGFLPEVCQAWEAACDPARQAGIRVVNLRIGVVLTPQGGALQQMLPIFQWGLGGVLGSGRQYWNWIAVDDLVAVIYHALTHWELQGPINAVAPNPVTNHEFTRTLATVLRRPAFFPVPRVAAQLALGQMAEDLLLASTRAVPNRLLDSGYRFRYPHLDVALRHVLGL